MNKKLYLIAVPILVVVFVIGSFVYMYNDLNKAINANKGTITASNPSGSQDGIDKNLSEADLSDNSATTSSTSLDSSKSSEVAADTSEAAEENNDVLVRVTYTVEEGDTLYAIANKFLPDYVSSEVVKFIMEDNDIDENIKVGQEITVPTVEND